MIIEEKVIVELKAKKILSEAHEAQLLNYLRATEIQIGLLLNFGKEPQFKRKFFSNEKKVFTPTTTKSDLLKSLFE